MNNSPQVFLFRCSAPFGPILESPLQGVPLEIFQPGKVNWTGLKGTVISHAMDNSDHQTINMSPQTALCFVFHVAF